MRQTGKQWSDQEDSLLWALWRDGLSLQRIAIRLRRTRRAIEVRLGFLRRRHTTTGNRRSADGPP